MAFVFRGASPCAFLPHELARLHVPGLGLADEWALAPYGIDDATDELHARRARRGTRCGSPRRASGRSRGGFTTGRTSTTHGPFTERAWTELQCDAAALAWLWLNRVAVGLGDASWERARGAVVRVAEARFVEEAKPFDPAWLATLRVQDLVAGDG